MLIQMFLVILSISLGLESKTGQPERMPCIPMPRWSMQSLANAYNEFGASNKCRRDWQWALNFFYSLRPKLLVISVFLDSTYIYKIYVCIYIISRYSMY